jgi:outer membrane protein assembly factor BamA
MSHGYADFGVISVDHTFDEAKGRYFVTFTIEEGAHYRFGAINIDSSLPGVNTARLKGLIKTRPNHTFNADLVEKTIENLNIELTREGYAFAQVRPRGDRGKKLRWAVNHATRAGVTGLSAPSCLSADMSSSFQSRGQTNTSNLHYRWTRRTASRVWVGSAPDQVTSAVGP